MEGADNFLQQNASRIFKPLLDYLATEGEVRGISEVYRHLSNRLLMPRNTLRLFPACEWLVEIGILQEVINPVKMTPKSRATVDEPAYYYDGG
jgi:hypothetical protein